MIRLTKKGAKDA